MGQLEDLSGREFGFLRVVEEAGRTRLGLRLWRCVCVCGRETRRTGGDLKRRPNASCGCQHKRLAAEANRTHGGCKSPEYNSWCGMKERCNNPKHPRFHDYGGRGISVCQRWRESFAAFLADMGPKPTSKHTIEREDNDAGYGPENCRWATRAEQNNNTRSSRLVAHDGRTLTVAQWGEETGIRPGVIWFRLSRGWSAAEALTIPVSRHNKIRSIRASRATGF